MGQHLSSHQFTQYNLADKPTCRAMNKTHQRELNIRFKNYEDNELIAQSTELDPIFRNYEFITEKKKKNRH